MLDKNTMLKLVITLNRDGVVGTMTDIADEIAPGARNSLILGVMEISAHGARRNNIKPAPGSPRVPSEAASTARELALGLRRTYGPSSDHHPLIDQAVKALDRLARE